MRQSGGPSLTGDGVCVVCSSRTITPSYGPNIGPFEPISVLVSHADSREYDDILVVAIRAWIPVNVCQTAVVKKY
jgi:hypothetical protein